MLIMCCKQCFTVTRGLSVALLGIVVLTAFTKGRSADFRNLAQTWRHTAQTGCAINPPKGTLRHAQLQATTPSHKHIHKTSSTAKMQKQSQRVLRVVWQGRMVVSPPQDLAAYPKRQPSLISGRCHYRCCCASTLLLDHSQHQNLYQMAVSLKTITSKQNRLNSQSDTYVLSNERKVRESACVLMKNATGSR